MSHNNSANAYEFLNKTNELLSEMPLYKKMKCQNDELKEKVKALKYTIEYLELINKNLTKKNKKLKTKLGKNLHNVVVHDDYEVEHVDPNIKMEIFEFDEEEIADSYLAGEYLTEDVEEEVVVTEDAEEEEVVVTEDAEDEEVVVTEDAEEEEEVVVTEDAEEEEEAEVTEDAEEEEAEVTEDAEEEEAEVTEDAEEEEEEEVTEDAEEEEADVYEVTIKGKSYYVSNEVDSLIYAADENGDISIEAGVYKNGKPTFYKTK